MAASANSIKKAMDLTRHQDGRIDMVIRLHMSAGRIVEVDGRWCGNFADEPALAAQGVNETVVATVTEFIKAVERG
jgi:hypothetical protein